MLQGLIYLGRLYEHIDRVHFVNDSEQIVLDFRLLFDRVDTVLEQDETFSSALRQRFVLQLDSLYLLL